ncbi:uncharacterized protein LAESUDRAFT_765518 [Laetiporus sulphureus 93-53]|uniref:Uncharacterized protein n=1 Tax=Laetiporus sulphureus 93-53 TaxID=1314785 RepID=A0A165AQF4_9APHY|nr:uncharacterized protein LAESUDRAFT_765518 [Laetiporus sulphureus 93-53]KZS99452.1 hypothetical protein LAESUDRAFT_765518 [Laetiporus sulphureus 93-53]
MASMLDWLMFHSRPEFDLWLTAAIGHTDLTAFHLAFINAGPLHSPTELHAKMTEIVEVIDRGTLSGAPQARVTACDSFLMGCVEDLVVDRHDTKFLGHVCSITFWWMCFDQDHMAVAATAMAAKPFCESSISASSVELTKHEFSETLTASASHAQSMVGSLAGSPEPPTPTMSSGKVPAMRAKAITPEVLREYLDIICNTSGVLKQVLVDFGKPWPSAKMNVSLSLFLRMPALCVPAFTAAWGTLHAVFSSPLLHSHSKTSPQVTTTCLNLYDEWKDLQVARTLGDEGVIETAVKAFASYLSALDDIPEETTHVHAKNFHKKAQALLDPIACPSWLVWCEELLFSGQAAALSGAKAM